MAERGQRQLPIDQTEMSRDSYASIARGLRLPGRHTAVICWLVHEGEKLGGVFVGKYCGQRSLAKLVGLSVGSVNAALKELQFSRLIIVADGEIRLPAERIVDLGDEIEKRRDDARHEREEVWSASDAVDSLRRGVQPRSTPFNSVQQRSIGARTERANILPPDTEHRTDTESGAESKTERGRTPLNGDEWRASDASMKFSDAWQALQTSHFRPRLDFDALRLCFVDAVERGLLIDDVESRRRFLANAHDLANDSQCRCPAVWLRSRAARGSMFRHSDAGWTFAKQHVNPPLIGVG